MKTNKMNESVIVQKLIQVGQMLERGELEYSGAEADTKHFLGQYLALHQPLVRGSVPNANPRIHPARSWLCDCHPQPCSYCSGNGR